MESSGEQTFEITINNKNITDDTGSNNLINFLNINKIKDSNNKQLLKDEVFNQLQYRFEDLTRLIEKIDQ